MRLRSKSGLAVNLLNLIVNFEQEDREDREEDKEDREEDKKSFVEFTSVALPLEHSVIGWVEDTEHNISSSLLVQEIQKMQMTSA